MASKGAETFGWQTRNKSKLFWIQYLHVFLRFWVFGEAIFKQFYVKHFQGV